MFLSGTGCVLLAIFNYNEDIKTVSRSLGMVQVGETSCRAAASSRIVAKTDIDMAGSRRRRR